MKSDIARPDPITHNTFLYFKNLQRAKSGLQPISSLCPFRDKSSITVRYEAHLQYGYTLKEIAEYIDLHYSTVSRAIKKIEGEDEK